MPEKLIAVALPPEAINKESDRAKSIWNGQQLIHRNHKQLPRNKSD